jgi:hypothetical protein
MQQIAKSIREQDTNPDERRLSRLTEKGLRALKSVLSTNNNSSLSRSQGSLSSRSQGSLSSRSQGSLSSRSQGSLSSRSQDSRSSRSQDSRSSRSQGYLSSIIQPISLRDIEIRNDAIIKKLNLMTIKTLIAISSLAGNTLYLNNIIITSASFISIFQITLFIFFNCIQRIESMRDNESMTEIEVQRILSINNDNNPGMIGGVGYNKKYVLETISILIKSKSSQNRNAIIYLFACIFVFVLLKKNDKYNNSKKNGL